MNMNALPSEQAAVVATIDPDAYAASTVLSDAIDMADFESIMAIIMAGTLVTNATLDAKLTQATTSGGTYKDITGKAITQLTEAGTDSDKQAIINCRREDLDIDNGYRYVKLSLTLATAGGDAGAAVLGFSPAVQPASDNDLASVDEIV